MSYNIVSSAFGDLNPSGMTAGSGTSTDDGESGTSATNPSAVQFPSPNDEPDMTGTGTRIPDPADGSYPSSGMSPTTAAKSSSGLGIALVGLLVVGGIGYLWFS